MKMLSSIIATLLISSTLFASNCSNFYVNNAEPKILSNQYAVNMQEVCYSYFVVNHSGLTKTPLWSAERLTRDQIIRAKNMNRTNSFHNEGKIVSSKRADLNDYSKNGRHLDRGHMAPSGDMPDVNAQWESFSLANMIPQNENNNRIVWAGIEASVRKMVLETGELYVITGPIFDKTSYSIGRNKVMVPSQIYKIVFDPRSNLGAVYLTNNNSSQEYAIISIQEIEKITGINFFPNLKDKTTKLQNLYPPTPLHFKN